MTGPGGIKLSDPITPTHVTGPAVKTISGQFSGGFNNKMYQPPIARQAPSSFVTGRPNFGNAGFTQHAVAFAPQHAAPSFGGGMPGQGGMVMGRSSFSGGGAACQWATQASAAASAAAGAERNRGYAGKPAYPSNAPRS
jgi:hypothetical protein